MCRSILLGSRPARVLALVFLVVLSISNPSLASELGEKINKGTVGIVTGSVDGTYARIASDLARVLDDGEKLRVLPILGKGSIQNIADILYLKGVDLGIVQSDVFAFMKREGIFPAIGQRIHYVSKLYNEEVHLLAHDSIASPADLDGRTVSFGTAGRFYMTGSVIFEHLGIRTKPVALDPALSLQKIIEGEIAAMVYVSGKPTRFFQELPADAPVKLLSLPLDPRLLDIYLPARLEAADYPGLIAPGESIDTLAVGAVMAVFNWAPETDRYAKVAAFIDAFFGSIEAFSSPARHAKWREVSLTAEVPGWTRFKAARDWLAAQ